MRRAIALLFVIALGVDAKNTSRRLTLRARRRQRQERRRELGRRAVHVVDTSPGTNGEAFVILRGSDFHDGTIEADIAGSPRTAASEGATQPCLIVNDLKLGDSSGAIALWIGSETDAYFSNVTVQ